MMKFWIYENHICELRSEEFNEDLRLLYLVSLQISFSWKSHENVLKNPWTFFHGHENSDFGFDGAKLHHEISMKFFTSYFHEPWKVYKAMNMAFHGSWKFHIF